VSPAEPPGAHPEGSPADGALAAVLADFQAWLSRAAAEPGTPGAAEAPAPPERIDLSTVLGHFVALRQEVNLQTRATRAQQEQNVETLRQLQQALAALERAQEAAAEGQLERVRPLLKTLVDLYDALSLAGRELGRAQDTVLPLLEQLVAPPETATEGGPVSQPPGAPGGSADLPQDRARPGTAPRRSCWQRWFGKAGNGEGAAEQLAAAERLHGVAQQLELAAERLRGATHRQERMAQGEQARQARAASERLRQVLAALVTGYTMSLQRIERALRQHDLEPIPTVGETFDPELMEVLEAVTGTGRPSGEVLQEVRRGYLWHGRVFRYAQVRVAKG
jgi:molecular chaperone GrpE